MGVNKQPIPPHTVCAYQELFHCMNTAFLVEADSLTCIGVRFDTAHCYLVIFCTPCHYLPPFPILYPAPSSSPVSPPNPILVTTTYFAVSPFPPSHTSLPLSLPSLPFSISHSPSELRGDSWQVTRVVKPDELGRPDESLREQMRELKLSPQATDSAAATTVSTCCHRYSPMCSRNAIYSLVTDLVLCSWPHDCIWPCAEPLLPFLHQMWHCSVHMVSHATY